MIDPTTGWFEIHQYDNKRAMSVANIVEEEWFSRYSWPTQVTFDRGTEFIGIEFQKMLDDYGVKKNPQTTRNPQANAIVVKEFTKQLVILSELLNSKIIILMKMILGRASWLQQPLQFVLLTIPHCRNLQDN
jgi:transposase InsO family protein